MIDPTSAEEAAALSHVTVCMSVTPPAPVLFFEHRGTVLIVQAFKGVGWEVYTASKYTNIDNIFKELEAL